MDKTAAERMARLYQRKRESGLRYVKVLVREDRPEDAEKIRQLAERLREAE